MILHSTSVEAALNILKDGQIMPSPGIAGEGIYCFAIADADDKTDAFEQAWLRGATGGYNRGAAFVLEVKGICCRAKPGDADAVVPPGAILLAKDQYAAHPTAVSYYSVTFQRDALISAIGKAMDEQGYSAALHKALVDIQAHLKSPSGPPPAQAVTLLNEIVQSGKQQPMAKQQRQQQQQLDAEPQQPQQPQQWQSQWQPQQPQQEQWQPHQWQSQWWQPQQWQPQQWQDGQWW
jgi:hypothetical protein